VDAKSVRVSLAPGALSLVFDPRRVSLERVTRALQLRLTRRGVDAALLKVLEA